MKNINSLLEKYTKEEFLNSSFQGINCPKWFGIEISCSNNCKSCWEKAITENNLKFKDERKFKVGDVVTGVDKYKRLYGKKAQIISVGYDDYDKQGYRVANNDLLWYDNELKLYEEPQTEFTFQEVIARNVPGIYECCVSIARLKKVEIKEDGRILITASKNVENEFAVPDYYKFKLQEPKKLYVLCEVIHAVRGKEYTFRPKEGYELVPHDWVVCDTKMGKSYGKVIGTITKELTEEEYLEYKECWRA